jgi:Class III cytochrome C family
MATPRRSQKQISEKYQGNLRYYNKIHFGRLARVAVSLLAISAGIAAIIVYQKRGHERFFNPGKLSTSHAALADGCASCHDKSSLTLGRLSDRFHHGVAFDPIDKNCEACHLKREKRTFAFHQPNVVKGRSCSVCHQEHRGSAAMRAVASANCAACHNDSSIMEAAALKGTQLPPAVFHFHSQPTQRVVFEMPRPARGYTNVFASFANGHPEFQLDSGKARDPDILRFNHQRHFAADIPLVNGKKLDCKFCHTTDADGRYYERISYTKNCQICHALQFDPKNPELTIPHGSATAVRAFLRTLPTQYADLAVRKKITKPNEIQNFVMKQMTQLRDRVRSGEEFERQVFFATDPYKPTRNGDTRTRASFAGCAFCHEVKPVANSAPAITKPLLVDRWMPLAKFNHAKHTSVKCDDCHHATLSRETSDVLMPVKANCVTCHSPQGKVVSECTTCHTYHAMPSVAAAENSSGSGSAFKQMLLDRER